MKTIWKKKDEIKAFVKVYGTSQCDDCKHVWDEKLIKMERFLALWIDMKEKPPPGQSTLAGRFKLLQQEQIYPSSVDACDSTISSLSAFNTIMVVLYKNSSYLLHLFPHPILYGHNRSVQ